MHGCRSGRAGLGRYLSKGTTARQDIASRSAARLPILKRQLMLRTSNQLYTASCDPGVHERLGAEEELRLWGPDAGGGAGGSGGYSGT